MLALLLVASVGSSSSYVYSMEAETSAGVDPVEKEKVTDEDGKSDDMSLCMLATVLFKGAADSTKTQLKTQFDKTGVSRKCINGHAKELEDWVLCYKGDAKKMYNAICAALQDSCKAKEEAEGNEDAEDVDKVADLETALGLTQVVLEKKNEEISRLQKRLEDVQGVLGQVMEQLDS